MTKLRALVIGVVALLAIAGFYFAQNKGREMNGSVSTSQTKSSTQSEHESQTAEPIGERSGQPPMAGITPHVRALDAATFSNLASNLREPSYSRGEEYFFRAHLAVLCSEPPGRRLAAPAATEGAPSESDISKATVRAFAKRFCSDFAGTLQEEIAGYDEISGEDKVAEAYEFAGVIYDASGSDAEGTAEESTMRQAAIKHLDSIMLSEGAGVEALVAAETLQLVGHTSPAVRELAEKSGWGLPVRDLTSAQTLAQQIAVCERYGGCGPNQALTMQQCSVKSICRPGMSAIDVWKRAYSPRVIEAAEAINKKL